MEDIYQIKEILTIPNLVHGFSFKEEGNMSFNWGEHEEVLNNRKNFLSKLGIDINSCVSTQLENNNNITIVDKKDLGKRMFDKSTLISGDGLITKEKDMFLFIVIGDCLPCIIFDRKQEIAGIFHLSWEATEAKICRKAIQIFLSEFKSSPDDIFVAIGPGIHKESHYFKDPIQKQLPGWENFLEDLPSGETSIDVISYNVSQIKSFGIPQDHIFISDIDTAQNIHFFSHRRDKREGNQQEGRFAAVVGFRSKTI